MTHRRPNNAAIAAWPGTNSAPASTESVPTTETATPSDADAMASRIFPLGRVRLAQAEPGGQDLTADTQAHSAGGAHQPYGGARVTAFPGHEAARVCRLIPTGQSRGAVLIGTRGNAVPARRVWGIPDLS